jgi:tetratricopeptide (TPR) repeat protein
MGDVMLARLDHASAKGQYERALPLYRQAGNALGEANCIRSLGNIALERSDLEAAKGLYEQAIPLYRQVGDVLGEANCIRSLGDVQLAYSDDAAARKNYELALVLFEKISEPYSIGWIHRRIALLERDNVHCLRSLATAVESWRTIDRTDLIQSLLQEFNLSEEDLFAKANA